jgi:CTP synthase
MPELDRQKMGGTMRLGLRPTIFQRGTEWSKLRTLYGEKDVIEERHRHRYEVNPEFVDRLTQAGMNFIGKDDTGERMEIFELRDHPYFVGTLLSNSLCYSPALPQHHTNSMKRNPVPRRVPVACA